MKQTKAKQILVEPHIGFFYKILSQYESEPNHNGFRYTRIDKKLLPQIKLEYKQKAPVNKPKDENTFYYTGNRKCADFLRHIRNSFAHCNIEYDDRKKKYSVSDYHQGECTMSGSMSETIFHKLIKELNDTRI